MESKDNKDREEGADDANREYGHGRMTFVQKLKSAPFPYHGKQADTGADFFDYLDPATGEKFHTNRFGQRFSEKGHYDDSRVLFYVPSAFDPEKPFAIVVFFHGHSTELERTVREYELLEQVEQTRKNYIFIAPQLAKNAVDSSPGKFFISNAFREFLKEAAVVAGGKFNSKTRGKFFKAPVIIAAFSGGYKSAACVLDRGGEESRIRGVILLDAPYEDEDKFTDWISRNRKKVFFVSLYTKDSETHNQRLMKTLGELKIKYSTSLPERIRQGDNYFIKIRAEHLNVPISGPPNHPLAYMLGIVTM